MSNSTNSDYTPLIVSVFTGTASFGGVLLFIFIVLSRGCMHQQRQAEKQKAEQQQTQYADPSAAQWQYDQR